MDLMMRIDPISTTYGEYEICTTQFNHPDVKTGQHTNGPANIFVRRNGGEWILAEERSMHKVRLNIDGGKYG